MDKDICKVIPEDAVPAEKVVDREGKVADVASARETRNGSGKALDSLVLNNDAPVIKKKRAEEHPRIDEDPEQRQAEQEKEDKLAPVLLQM